ncbi:hypothetical protein AJ85_04540 [Alkalihalobacillus alcalophilus ATCC 27647 = CGMCC 1.3604]|uniref:PepSY domain-containing protein n=1 Tax=Alkalihalobacillus alcalophilus ATCC 27647 = CGMCC 1.3604 TaxID=1218173 RepID=A0A094WPE7_ALKAL|nr:hypothetical protein [Alkalihalobacillus alcalophilus]KGA97878.1 hypothetical protein BALCAV_0207535 [Alkalihalobacillus alcalophilus ATCC 27647 = CGMCC 1.3604]MED1562125.1 hypothetical protein [Alkalihalobacillus alcalophilus]THG91501.1 hypothetical protein AJ85_04540 [Alkalihalobacillus alcalophilus ATCC 27647 = CGMCC 1.3604]
MKKVYILSLLVALLFVTACTSQVYKEHKEEALEAIKEERYEDAKMALESALEEKEEADDFIILADVESMIELHLSFNEGDFETAHSHILDIEESESDSEETQLLQAQADVQKDLLLLVETQMNELADLLAEVSTLYEEEAYEEAFDRVEGYEVPEEPHAVLEELLAELGEWRARLEEALEADDEGEEVVEPEAEEVVEETTEDENTNDSNETDNNDSTDSSNSGQDTVGGNDDYEAPEGTMSRDDAAELVAVFAGIENSPNYQVQYDHENADGEWVFQVYEVVIDNPDTSEGHTSTWGWYSVDPKTGNVTDLMN